MTLYLNDFGVRGITELSSRRREPTEWTVGHLLGMYIRLGNWHLVGELLLACHCLGGSTGSQLYDLGWGGLFSAQWSDGCVRGPHFNSVKEENLDVAGRHEYPFEECYHTTLVAALAGGLCANHRGGGGEGN